MGELLDGCAPHLDHGDLEVTLRTIRRELPPGAPPEMRAKLEMLFRQADQGRWITDLLDAIVAIPHLAPEVTQCCTGVRMRLVMQAQIAGYQARTPWKALVTRQRAFVDRDKLRTLAWHYLGGQNTPPILLVVTDGAIGKSHVWNLLGHLGDILPNMLCELLDFRRFGQPSIGPRHVFETIVQRLNLNVTPSVDSLAQETRVVRKLVDALIGGFRRQPHDRHFCLVFDNLNYPTLEPEVFELIVELAHAVQSGSIQRVRLALIGFDRDLPPECEICTVTHTLDQITTEHVRTYLRDIFAAAGRSLGPPELDQLLNEAMQGLATPFDAKSLRELERRLLKLWRSMHAL
ncbi:MAG: hypothetical protein KF715_19840 [Candidatus Didemnitutus sp.]|nr:hypothetical protein [Candidatus Didemnitutus sp.]